MSEPTALEVRLSRHEGIVLPSEAHELHRYVAWFWEVFDAEGGDRDDPSQIDLLLARLVAAEMWRVDRETNDVAAYYEVCAGAHTQSDRRAGAERVIREGVRLREACLVSLRQVREFRALLPSARRTTHNAGVLPLRAVSGPE